MNVERLKKEIEHQTRNGRREVYVRTTDLLDLLPNINENGVKDRLTIDLDELTYLLEEYERKHFKDKYKVENTNTKLVQKDNMKYKFEEIER